MTEQMTVSIGCKIAPWVFPWMECTKFFIEKYGWPFEEKDIEQIAKKIYKEGLTFTAKASPPYEKFFGGEIKLV